MLIKEIKGPIRHAGTRTEISPKTKEATPEPDLMEGSCNDIHHGIRGDINSVDLVNTGDLKGTCTFYNTTDCSGNHWIKIIPGKTFITQSLPDGQGPEQQDYLRSYSCELLRTDGEDP